MENINTKEENYEVDIDKLKEQFAELITEYTDIICRQYNRLMADYLEKLGDLEYEEMIVRTEVMEQKKKMSVILESMNMGSRVDADNIDNQVKEALKEQYEKVNCMKNDMELSKEVLAKKKLTDNQLKELKYVCKEIIVRIHPDIKEAVNEKDKELWNDAMDAYKKEDISALKTVLKKVSEVNNVTNEAGKIKGLDVKNGDCGDLKKKIDEYIYRIKEARKLFPFNKEEFLADKEKVSKRRSELEDNIKTQKEYLEEMKRKCEFMMSAM